MADISNNVPVTVCMPVYNDAFYVRDAKTTASAISTGALLYPDFPDAEVTIEPF